VLREVQKLRYPIDLDTTLFASINPAYDFLALPDFVMAVASTTADIVFGSDTARSAQVESRTTLDEVCIDHGVASTYPPSTAGVG